jgi:hypothetical protein
MRTGKWILILVMAAPAYAQNHGRPPLYQRNLVEPGDPARDLFVAGQQFYDQFRFADAEATFREVTQKYPRSSIADRAEYYLIRTLVRTGNNAEALNHINAFRKTYPKSPWNGDVEEQRMQLTNQVPAAAQAILVRVGARPVPLPPRPAPPAVRVDPIEIQNLDPQISLMQEALRVMIRSDIPRAVQIASERLRANMADPVVISTMSTLAISAVPQGLPILVEIAKNSPDIKARKDAVFWLSRAPANKDLIVDTLVSLLPTLGDDNCDAVTYGLGQIRTEKSFNALAGLVTDKTRSEKLHQQALLVLGQAHDPRTVPLLENIATGDSDIRLRSEAVRWLGQIRGPEATSVLENLLRKK